MKCSKCGNDYCGIMADTQTTGKDYSICQGMLGEALFGTSGFICGISDSRDTKVESYWVCKRCGYKFKA